MSTAKKIAKNTSILFTGSIISKIFTFILTIFIARLLGNAEFGKFSFAISFASLFLILTDFGLKNLIQREIARDKASVNRYIGTSLVIKIFLSLITLFLIFVTINLLDYPADTTLAVYIAAMIIILESFSDTFASAFNAFEKMSYAVFAKLVRVILRFAITLPLLFLGYGLVTVLIVFLGVHLIDLVIHIFIYFRRIGNLDLNFRFEFSKELIKRAIPFGIATIFIVIYFKIDITMLSKMKGDSVVGWYSAAYSLMEGLYFFPQALVTALGPITAIYFLKSKEKLIEVYKISFKYILFFSIPVAIITTLLSDSIILSFYGNDFFNSIKALQILIWSIIPAFLTYILGLMLVSSNRENVGMYTTGLTAFINVGLNLLLIPKYSYIGAAIATIICEVILLIINYTLVSKYLYRLPLLEISVKPIIAGILLAIFVSYLKFLNFIIVAVLGIAFYLGLMILFRAFKKEDRELFLKLFKKEKLAIPSDYQ